MPKITIDGKVVEVEDGVTILEAAKRLGILIPHFCYHPMLTIAGNCRMCSVEVEGQSKPVISCREPVKEGMVVKTNSPMAVSVRKSVLEFILINHPIDCPVCDQSGECKLQDYYFEHSLEPSRLGDEKVHKPKAVQIGPHIMLDAERCVECTRCVRFCREITKTNELTIKERTDRSEVTIYPGGELNNPYSLCTVDLCPVGALTSREFRFKKRAWFLKSAPSVCNHCATGCNIFIDHHDGIVYRYRPRENLEVNGHCMCDEGRLSHVRINAEDRALFPSVAKDGDLVRVSWEEALLKASDFIKSVNQDDVALILSARATLEENEALAGFFRDVVKTPNIYWSGLNADPKFADTILRDADKNPNVNGVKTITDRRLDEKSAAKIYFILDGLTDRELMQIVSSRPKAIVLIASHYDSHQHYPEIVLPKASFAEQAGTFTNRNGIRQKFQKAVEPLGESLSGVEIAAKLGENFLPFVRGG